MYIFIMTTPSETLSHHLLSLHVSVLKMTTLECMCSAGSMAESQSPHSWTWSVLNNTYCHLAKLPVLQAM